MPYLLPETAVGDALYAVFQDPTLAALATGGVHTDVRVGEHTYPFLWFELLQGTNYGGLGTKPGRGSMPGLTVRLHVFQSEHGTKREAELLMARAIEVLFTIPLVVDGYTVASGEPLPEVEGMPFEFEELNGVPVLEFVKNLELIVEEVA